MIEYRAVWACSQVAWHREIADLIAAGWEPIPETMHLDTSEPHFYGFMILKRSEERAAVFETSP